MWLIDHTLVYFTTSDKVKAGSTSSWTSYQIPPLKAVSHHSGFFGNNYRDFVIPRTTRSYSGPESVELRPTYLLNITSSKRSDRDQTEGLVYNHRSRRRLRGDTLGPQAVSEISRHSLRVTFFLELEICAVSNLLRFLKGQSTAKPRAPSGDLALELEAPRGPLILLSLHPSCTHFASNGSKVTLCPNAAYRPWTIPAAIICGFWAHKAFFPCVLCVCASRSHRQHSQCALVCPVVCLFC